MLYFAGGSGKKFPMSGASGLAKHLKPVHNPILLKTIFWIGWQTGWGEAPIPIKLIKSSEHYDDEIGLICSVDFFI